MTSWLEVLLALVFFAAGAVVRDRIMARLAWRTHCVPLILMSASTAQDYLGLGNASVRIYLRVYGESVLAPFGDGNIPKLMERQAVFFASLSEALVELDHRMLPVIQITCRLHGLPATLRALDHLASYWPHYRAAANRRFNEYNARVKAA